METFNFKSSIKEGVLRESGIELFRIITMLIIVAHHYVVNSGLTEIMEKNAFSPNSIFLYLFGWGGKTGINCFVLITGYFMCRSNITLKKFLKLFLQREFYAIVILAIFMISGYCDFSIKTVIKTVLPVFTVKSNFTTCYIIFFLFIPFLNLLIGAMNKKQHSILLVLALSVYTILPSFATTKISFNYVTWFMIIYLIGAHIRIYPNKVSGDKKLWGFATLAMIIISWCSIIALLWLSNKTGKSGIQYYFVEDSNKILAVLTSISAFFFFKNLNIGYNRFINSVAASTFGVLLIHANSDAMRQWLWKDVLNNVGQYDSELLVAHAVCSVLCVYIICTVIDMLRIKYLEKPLFKYLEKYNIK